MIFTEQEIKFFKLIGKWFEENKRPVTRDEAIKVMRVDGDTYEVLVKKMLHVGAIEKVESNMRDGKYAQFWPSARAVELLREIEAPVDLVEKWTKKIRQNPRTAWIVLIWEFLERILKLFCPK